MRRPYYPRAWYRRVRGDSSPRDPFGLIKLLLRRVAIFTLRAPTTVLAYSCTTALLAIISLTTVLAD